jgi:hypothetical protein
MDTNPSGCDTAWQLIYKMVVRVQENLSQSVIDANNIAPSGCDTRQQLLQKFLLTLQLL